MNEEYRTPLLLCPACSVEMEARQLADATVDVCPGCKGLWVDWFDGDLAQVAFQAAPLSIPSAPAPAMAASRAACPHCERALALQPYGPDGQSFWRCSECVGTFVPRSTFETLLDIAARPDPDPEPPQTDEQTGALARLLKVLSGLLKG
jgi:Zn-finger nucleic acid-binding protein